MGEEIQTPAFPYTISLCLTLFLFPLLPKCGHHIQGISFLSRGDAHQIGESAGLRVGHCVVESLLMSLVSQCSLKWHWPGRVLLGRVPAFPFCSSVSPISPPFLFPHNKVISRCLLFCSQTFLLPLLSFRGSKVRLFP